MAAIDQIGVTRIDGTPARIGDYAGKVRLIVNTASKCGFTPQYEGLERLHEEYAARGLAVLGFPCNQFRAQEPGDEAEIANFCSLTYDVKFPMFAKVEVNGDGAHPLFRYLKHEAQGRARQRGDQVELHQVPRRSRRQGRRPLRPHHQAGGAARRYREAAIAARPPSRRSAVLRLEPRLKHQYVPQMMLHVDAAREVGVPHLADRSRPPLAFLLQPPLVRVRLAMPLDYKVREGRSATNSARADRTRA